MPPIYVRGMDLSCSPVLCDATHAQLELFYTLPSDLQRMVFRGDWPDELLRSTQDCCNPRYGLCNLQFNLLGFFMFRDALAAYAHYRVHGMCANCKEEHDRRAARRQERLDGLVRYQLACASHDEQAMRTFMQWHGVEELYDVCRDWDDYEERLERRARYAREYRAGLYMEGL